MESQVRPLDGASLGSGMGASLALGENLEAVYQCRFSLKQSFLSVTKLQLMVPCAAQFTHHRSSRLPGAKNFPNSLC